MDDRNEYLIPKPVTTRWGIEFAGPWMTITLGFVELVSLGIAILVAVGLYKLLAALRLPTPAALSLSALPPVLCLFAFAPGPDSLTVADYVRRAYRWLRRPKIYYPGG